MKPQPRVAVYLSLAVLFTAATAVADSYDVSIQNSRSDAIHVSFTSHDHSPGPITWGSGCQVSGTSAEIAAGDTCQATVATDAGPTRFCASETAAPADCFDAQQNHLTMIETNFETSANSGCFNKGKPCVWYDISVIPSNCTDSDWKSDQCANTGGASYNLPVSMACGGTTVYTCAGPVSSRWGPENYPENCGNPDATCTANSPGGNSPADCVNAYFYPMFDPPENQYGPNTACLDGQALGINFLAGQ